MYWIINGYGFNKTMIDTGDVSHITGEWYPDSDIVFGFILRDGSKMTFTADHGNDGDAGELIDLVMVMAAKYGYVDKIVHGADVVECAKRTKEVMEEGDEI